MKDKLRSLFLNNVGLKLLGVVLAVLLWLVLSNTQDPVISTSVTVPITYDESGLAEKNLVAISKPSTISIPVMVRRSRLRYLSADDFIVTADLTEVIGDVKEAPDASKISIEIAKVPSANYIQSWEYPQSQGYVRVVLDTLKTASYLVQFNVTKELPEGYQVGTLSCTPSRVTVSGPTSAFSSLASVKANVDLSLLSEGNTTITASLALYDGNNRQLTASSLTLSQDTVEVSVGLNQTKEISISFAAYSGMPADGYVVSKVDYSPKLLTISGSQNALANISTISIPKEEIDITGADGSRTFTIDILPYLPEGVSVSEGQSTQVSVTIELEQLQEQSYSVPAGRLELVNTKEHYEYELIDNEVSLTLRALKADLESFDPLSLKGSIDVGGLEPGEYISVPVAVSVDSAYIVAGEVTAAIRITDKEAQDTQKEPASSSDGEDQTEGAAKDTSAESAAQTEAETVHDS